MRMVPDDEFKLRFPVAKDRTIRRISTIQMAIGLVLLLSLLTIFVSCNASMYIEDGVYKDDVFNAADFIMIGSLGILILTLPASWIVNLIESVVFTRRYGWRAMKDPIEAQRVAMREALYDVATGSARAEVEPERGGDRIMVVPVRRLRPAGARLELTADREKAQAPQQGS